MNITLFGGAFNPPHLGHLLVIEQAFELIPSMDELWLLPAYKHTFQKTLAPTKHRLEMTKLFMNSLTHSAKSRTKLSKVEIDNKMSGETFESLILLKKLYPNHTFSFLMGSDNLRDFKKWGDWEKLHKQMRFFIYPRAGYRHEKLFPNMTLLKSQTQVITNLSSTLTRGRIKQGQNIQLLVPSAVLKYLRVHKLYH